MKLIVGLGNPGQTYARNRHNVGFLAVEHLARRHGFGPWKSKFQGRASEGEIGGVKIVLLAPQTYMNDSGRAVQEAARFLKIADADIIVLHDELDLTPGKVRVKLGGGNAGHNGLRSITAHRSNDYVRVRLGIGHPGQKELVHNWVLGDFSKSDQAWLETLLDAVADAAPVLVAGDTERFMSDVARLTGQDAPASKPKPAPAPASKPKPAPASKPKPAPASKPEPASATQPTSPAKPAGRHPAGERASKQASAIADNLKKWLDARLKK
jgi:peptidyl-tRNA hydrolase, PTH1 family